LIGGSLKGDYFKLLYLLSKYTEGEDDEDEEDWEQEEEKEEEEEEAAWGL
jgi:hypothetical protein